MSNSRPADFYIDGAGKAKRDFCVDVVITDERNARRSTTSPIEQERRAQSAGRAARMAERGKRAAKVDGHDETKEEMLRQRDLEFVPLGFEVGGGCGAEWVKLLKKSF